MFLKESILLRYLIIFLALALNACGGDSTIQQSQTTLTAIPSSATWFLQLQGSHNLNQPVQLYELDLFDASSSDISTLRGNNIIVVCYFSAGSYEDWRSDISSFHSNDLGTALAGWPGEYWLDIRSTNVRNIMKNRIQLAKSKGCDAVDPDNVDGFTQTTGFPLTAADQLSFNKFLAQTAHSKGLAIALKNDLGQIAELEPFFDFAVNEQCIAFGECHLLDNFKNSNKLIINIEYDPSLIVTVASQTALCMNAGSLGMMTKVLTDDLDGTVLHSCF